VRGRIRWTREAMEKARDDLAPLASEEFLRNAPFTHISLIFRYGSKAGLPEIERIRNGELQMSVEVDMSASAGKSLEALTAEYRSLALKALVLVAGRFGLDGSHLSAPR